MKIRMRGDSYSTICWAGKWLMTKFCGKLNIVLHLNGPWSKQWRTIEGNGDSLNHSVSRFSISKQLPLPMTQQSIRKNKFWKRSERTSGLRNVLCGFRTAFCCTYTLIFALNLLAAVEICYSSFLANLFSLHLNEALRFIVQRIYLSQCS